MDHFINSKETIVTDAIDGFLLGRGNTITRLDGYPDQLGLLGADFSLGESGGLAPPCGETLGGDERPGQTAGCLSSCESPYCI